MERVSIFTSQEYSIYTQELLAKPPSWLLRCGGGLIFSIIMTMLLITCLIQYPDIITARATITTPIPPIAIIARQSGKLHWIKSPQDFNIAKNESIAIIENSATTEDINLLKQWLSVYISPKQNQDHLPDRLQLGEVQNSFAHFQKLLNEFNFFHKLNPLAKKLLLNEQKQQQFQQMLKQSNRQIFILMSEKRLINKNLQRFLKLQHKNLVSESKIDEIKITLLKNQRQQELIRVDIARVKVSMTNLDVNLTDYKVTNQKKLKDFKLKLAEALQSLQAVISTWEKRYLLKSPINGRLTFSKYWSEHQYVKADEEVVTVVPNANQPIIAKIKMPVENSGKVKQGQKILIKLESYPYQEYGQIESRVDSISLVPRDGVYTIEAQLPSPLLTSFNKTINFKQEMQGKAEIVTEEMRLIERFFYQILKIIKA